MNRHLSTLAFGLLAVIGLQGAGCTNDGVFTPFEPEPGPGPEPLTTHEELRDDMRQLWIEHVEWTRVFLISTIANLPDQQEATERLFRNQVDLGDAMRPFYGDAFADELTELLNEHILGAAAIVDAVLSDDQSGFESARDAWYVNYYEIAALIAEANPELDEEEFRVMMREHLDTTLAEATARLNGDFAGDVVAYDVVQDHILNLADLLTDGVAEQFPDLVSAPSVSAREEELHLTMRELWQEHVFWTRNFLMSDIAELPGSALVTNRLLQNQVHLGDAIRPFYGDAAADQLTDLLTVHIVGAVDVVDAAKEGDAEDFKEASDAWYENGDEIAAFLADANPAWSEGEMARMMGEHLDVTLAEASARLDGDWTADVEAYDLVGEQIREMADMLTDGIIEQFPSGPVQ